jgi:hypothetical protein
MEDDDEEVATIRESPGFAVDLEAVLWKVQPPDKVRALRRAGRTHA